VCLCLGYQVMDLCLRLQVFLQGPEWQFKGWDLSCYGGKMVNMFQRVCAFHVVERERGMVVGERGVDGE
jgi:hypothetical protein